MATDKDGNALGAGVQLIEPDDPDQVVKEVETELIVPLALELVDRGVDQVVKEVETELIEVESRAPFEIYEDNEEHRWRLRHRNGNIIADSGEGYSSRSACEDAINSVKNNAPGADESE